MTVKYAWAVFFTYFSECRSNSHQQESITVWSSLHRKGYSSHLYYLHMLRVILHQFQTRSPFKTYQTFSMSLPRKTKQICFPLQRVQFLLIWCSPRTDPNIMHFPSPENLHTAQQTDKYLIGQPSVPPHPPFHGSSYSGHESTTGCACHVSLWESKPMWGQSLPRSPVDASPAGAGGACLPGYERRTDARA